MATPCGHLFCSDCLNQHLGNSNTCPTCRKSFQGEQPLQIFLWILIQVLLYYGYMWESKLYFSCFTIRYIKLIPVENLDEQWKEKWGFAQFLLLLPPAPDLWQVSSKVSCWSSSQDSSLASSIGRELHERQPAASGEQIPAWLASQHIWEVERGRRRLQFPPKFTFVQWACLAAQLGVEEVVAELKEGWLSKVICVKSEPGEDHCCTASLCWELFRRPNRDFKRKRHKIWHFKLCGVLLLRLCACNWSLKARLSSH